MTHLKRRRWLLAGMGLAVAACSGGGEVIPPPPDVASQAALLSFEGDSACTELEQYIEDTAVLQMRTELEAARDGLPSWGWWGGWFRGCGGFGPCPAAAGAEDTASRAGPTNFTTTNTQVAGVDEADFVKNDGTRIFALSGQKLYAVRSWPPEQAGLMGSLAIEGYPREMFLDGEDTLVVFSSIWKWYSIMASGAPCPANGLDCAYASANTVKVTVVDVSDLSSLKVKKAYHLPGQYDSARKVGSSVRLVLSDGFNYPAGFRWFPDYQPGIWEDTPAAKAARRSAYDTIIAENERLIRKQTLADWVPSATVEQGGASTPVPHACTSFARVNAPTRLGTVSVVTLNLAADSMDRTSIIGESGEIYASAKNLYIATRHWWWWPRPGQTDTTYIHKFDISNSGKATYLASGTVDGHIVDQFSMDEASTGHFRVVTTIASRVLDIENPQNTWGRIELNNRLTVLGENAGRLEVVGRSPDLAKGERVTGSRIIGDKGFVVTFRNVDPLFTFDLSDPRNPRVLGELKIPGFSTYLHPLDADHLLTIGTYVPEPVNGEPVDWRARALQLAIFDVSDLRNPVQTHTQLVGTAYGWSEAQWEHKAFNSFAAKKLLAIPFSDWSYGTDGSFRWDRFTSELKVYSVDPATGFTPRGAVSLSDMYIHERYGEWSWYWTPSVRRSVMADDYVYAISDAGLRVAHIANLSVPLATVTFERYRETK